MANGAFKFKDNSGNVVSYISGSGQNIYFSGGTLNLSGMSAITLGNTTLTATSASYAGNYLLTSSFNSYTGTTNASARLMSIETKTGSFATTGSNVFKGNQTFSGSLVPSVDGLYDLGDPTHQFRHLYLSSASLYIDGTKVLGSTTQELQITTDDGQSFKILEAGSDNITLQSADGNIEIKTSGGGDVILDPNTGIIALKGSTTVYSGYRILSSDGNNVHFGNGVTISGSLLATGTSLVSGSSQITYSGLSGVPSGIISGSGQLGGFGFATTGSNNFQGIQTITGSLYISQNLVVQGSSSLEDITGSNVYIGTNKINLNTDTPSIRFGGVSVFDSGSNFGESGSLLWDSQNNRWLYQHPASSGAPYKSAIIISGPQNSGDLGSESTLTSGKISKAVGDDHIGDSIITETGGGIGISGSLSISGSVTTTNNIGVGGSPSGTYGALSVFGGVSIKNDNNGKLEIGRYSSGTPNSYIKLGANSNSLRITNNTDLADILYLNNDGNLGLGVTPNSWTTPFTVIQGGSYGQSIGFQSNGPDIKLGTNNYYNGSGYLYVTSSHGAAQLNVGGNSGFQFNTAPSGTSGAPITFTTAMFITNVGKVGIGVSESTSAYLDITGGHTSTNSLQLRSGNQSTGTTSNQILFGYNGTESYRHSIKTRHMSESASGNSIDFYVWKHGTDSVSTIGTQHVMSLNGGNVGIGTMFPSQKLSIGTITGGGTATSTPTCVTLDDTFGNNTIGTNLKLKIFQDNSNNRYGLGVSDSLFEIVSGNGGGIGFFTNGANERVRINSNGQMTLPYQPAFYAWVSGGSSTRTTGAFTSFSSTRVNRGGHYNTSNGRFTAPIAGVYEFIFSMLWRQSGSGGSGEISIGVNGSNIGSRGLGYSMSLAGGDYHGQTVARAILNLAAGDYVTGWIHSSGDSTANWYFGENLGYFSGYLLG